MAKTDTEYTKNLSASMFMLEFTGKYNPSKKLSGIEKVPDKSNFVALSDSG